MSEEEIKKTAIKLSETYVKKVKEAAINIGGTLNEAAAQGHQSGYINGYLDAKSLPVKPVEDNLAIQFAEWIPGSGFTQIAKRLGGYWFRHKDAKKWSTKEVFEYFISSLPPVPVKDVPVEDKKGSKEYWEQRCLMLENSLDETLTDKGREECYHTWHQLKTQ